MTRLRAIDFTCPKCGAKAGEGCVLITRSYRYDPWKFKWGWSEPGEQALRTHKERVQLKDK